MVITLASLITYSAISFLVAAFISTNNSFTLCPNFNLKSFETELCMKSHRIEGHSSFAQVYIIAYTLHPMLPASSCTSISQSDSMFLSGYNFVWWNQWAPPSASHLCTKLGDDCWRSGCCCHSALHESQPRKLFLATLGGYLTLVCLCPLPTLSPVTCCLAIPSSLAPEPHLHMSSNTAQLTVAKSIQHYRNFPKAGRSRKSPKNLQPQFPSAAVHLDGDSDGFVPA